MVEPVKNKTGLDFAEHKFTACLFEDEIKLNVKVILKTHRRDLHVDIHCLTCT